MPIPAVDKAESEAGLAMQVNGIAPGILAEEAKRLGALLVHYSTDYVFDGTKAGPYTEQDRTNPLSVYGRTKLEGEDAIAGEGGRFLTLRTSWVYGPRGKGFYPAILSQARAGNPLRVVNDQTGVPTSSAFLAKYTLPLVRRGATGVVNLVPCGETSRLGFAREILRGAGLQAKVEPISTTDTRTAAQRPLYSVLDNRVALSLLGPLPDWGEALAEIATAGRAT
jgi:dTDP-4-dehydrorhamnose reductase